VSRYNYEILSKEGAIERLKALVKYVDEMEVKVANAEQFAREEYERGASDQSLFDLEIVYGLQENISNLEKIIGEKEKLERQRKAAIKRAKRAVMQRNQATSRQRRVSEIASHLL
jgi:hypothetical protein